MKSKAEIKKSLISAGIKNLKEFGYPFVTDENILSDIIYSSFFKNMLSDNKGHLSHIDPIIDEMIAEIEKNANVIS